MYASKYISIKGVQMSVRPLGKFILATPIIVDENKTQSGLIVTTDSDDKLPEAIVVEIGDGYFAPDGTRYPIPLKKGDRVAYIKGHKTDFELDNEKFVFLNLDSIIAIIESAKEEGE